MKRQLYTELISWKKSKHRKPLLLQGARQVGKTYLVEEFAKKEYSNYIYFNFEQVPDLKLLFKGNLDPKRLIADLSLYIGKKILSDDTLIFFDEIQVSPEALISLKYVNEQASHYHIISAGSLLGVSIGKQSNFPVGKVNFMTMYPMSFAEYLFAFGEELLLKELENRKTFQPLPEIIHEKLLGHLKMYLYLGGMPEVLKSYLDERDIALARKIQNEILEAYQRDFSKYSEKSLAIKISELWHSIPYQLSKENKKFKYSDVVKKARASSYEQTIEWLKNAGLIYLSYNISTPKIPLKGYSDNTKFKIYFHDTGLLGAMLKISSDLIIKPTELFSEYNGAFVKNLIATELTSSLRRELFYWTSQNEAEVDFILQQGNEIYPLEVKSGSNRNIKSLRSYEEKFKPKLIFRVSPRNFYRDKEFINIPLYAVSFVLSLD